ARAARDHGCARRDAAAQCGPGRPRRPDRRPGSGIAGGWAVKALFGEEAVTRDITVRVSVSYLPEQSEPNRGRWFWAYHIRIENGSHQAVQLLTRHWIITDGRGMRHTVEGEGVVGEQPMIAPGSSYDYV